MENAASLATGPDGRKRRVSYFFEPEISQPMEPYASHMAHNLILTHGLHRHMEISRPYLAGVSNFIRFHSPEYIQFLSFLMPMTVNDPSVCLNIRRFFNGDVRLDRYGPVFHGLFDYCRAYAGCSLSAAAKLNRQEADIPINWSGGMHHAKIDQASEFCFVNDIVLEILELLKVFKRVLYIDIGLRHGDAVEEAFDNTDRVMTVSFHTFTDNPFPRNGDRRELYSLNAPLIFWLKDKSLRNKALEVYQPELIVLQDGADSLADDLFPRFNLKIKGHGDCLQFIRSFNVPLMVLGRGGSARVLPVAGATSCCCWDWGTT